MIRALTAIAILVSAPAGAVPRFIPSPKHAFSEFVALNAPRAEVPVGALWIDGYGPTGAPATADNLATERSLNGMLIDKNLQLSLSAGVFDLIGIEPRLRGHYTARFGDLSIVRVKDVSRLSGPVGEPRIIQAMKAATILVSSDGEVGLNARTGWRLERHDGYTTNASGKRYNIEGRDLFIAIRVATQELTEGKEQQLQLRGKAPTRVARLDDFEIIVRQEECKTEAGCTGLSAAMIKLSTHPSTPPSTFVPINLSSTTKLELPVPVADSEGGLYDHLALRLVRPCAPAKAKTCRGDFRLFAHYEGTRVADLRKPDMARW